MYCTSWKDCSETERLKELVRQRLRLVIVGQGGQTDWVYWTRNAKWIGFSEKERGKMNWHRDVQVIVGDRRCTFT